jgi:hypothetical protein
MSIKQRKAIQGMVSDLRMARDSLNRAAEFALLGSQDGLAPELAHISGRLRVMEALYQQSLNNSEAVERAPQ